MKKISKEQFTNLKFKKRGISISKLNQIILNLEVNEALVIKKEEWHLKTSPVLRVQSDCSSKKSVLFRNKVKVKCRTLADGSGWSILKIE